jgi:DNA-binding IclR family transcriptional regulator
MQSRLSFLAASRAVELEHVRLQALLGPFFAVALLAFKLEDDRAVDQAIDRGHGGHRVLEDLIPLTEELTAASERIETRNSRTATAPCRLAAPVFDGSAKCVAAVAVTAPALRIRSADSI